MSREIRFRAWDIENKLMSEPVSPFENQHIKFVMSSDYTVSVPTSDIASIYGPEHEIMQYTGLKDRNGTEIYEHDILAIEETRGSSTYANGQHVGTRTWLYTKKHVVEFTPSGLQLVDYYARMNCCEVIGNIYENPELLKEGEVV